MKFVAVSDGAHVSIIRPDGSIPAEFALDVSDMAVAPDGSFIAIASGDVSVYIIHTADWTVTTVTLDDFAYWVAVAPDSSLIAVSGGQQDLITGYDSNFVATIAPDGTVVSTTDIADGDYSFSSAPAFSPDSSQVAVGIFGSNTYEPPAGKVRIIDATGGIVQTVDLVGIPDESDYRPRKPFNRPTFTPDGSYVVAALLVVDPALSYQSVGEVAVIDTAGWGASIIRLPVGAPDYSLGDPLMSPDGSFVLISRGTGDTNVLSTSGWSVTNTVTHVGFPAAIAPDSSYVVFNDGAVVETSGWSVAHTVTLPGDAFAVAISSDGSLVAIPEYDTTGNVSLIETAGWTITHDVVTSSNNYPGFVGIGSVGGRGQRFQVVVI